MVSVAIQSSASLRAYLLSTLHILEIILERFSLHSSLDQHSNTKMLSKSILALALAPVAFAHFNLNYPETRGFDEDKEPTGPCGGYDTVASQRTDFPISGGPIQLTLGHQQTNVEVYLAVGDNPGNAFNTVLYPQFQVAGLGKFCLGDVSIPSSLNVTEGTKATIQVITKANGEDTPLYQVSEHHIEWVT